MCLIDTFDTWDSDSDVEVRVVLDPTSKAGFIYWL